MRKNIVVVDEQGNEYEATYPKRAKGLVKNGRARFVSENKICLVCPPVIMEDKKMSNNIDLEQQEKASDLNDVNKDFSIPPMQKLSEEFEKAFGKMDSKFNEKLSINYVFEQIEKIAFQNEYLDNIIQKIGEIPLTQAGDIVGAGKAEALSNLIRCKETTNQQLIKFYEKVYDDLKLSTQEPKRSNVVTQFDEMTNWLKTLNKDEYSPETWETIQNAVTAQLTRFF